MDICHVDPIVMKQYQKNYLTYVHFSTKFFLLFSIHDKMGHKTFVIVCKYK